MKHIPISAVITSSAIAVSDAFSLPLPRTALHLFIQKPLSLTSESTSSLLATATNIDPIIGSSINTRRELISFLPSQISTKQRATLQHNPSRYGGRANSGSSHVVAPNINVNINALDFENNRAILGFDLGLNMVSQSVDSSDWAGASASPIKKQIASNLQTQSEWQSSFLTQSPLTFFEGRERFRDAYDEVQSEYSSTSGKNKSSVPGWFPYTPTRRQIEILKVAELRDACYERGLAKSGNKSQLQQKLLDWTNDQHKRRVLERSALHTYTGDSPLQALQEAINKALYNNAEVAPQKQNEKILEELNSEISGADIDNVEPLINRRKELLRSKQFSFSKSKGKLGFDAGIDEDDDDEMISDDDLHLLPTKDYIQDLKKTFAKNVDASPNNYKVKQLYQDAKYADQAGDFERSKSFLLQLRQVAPRDTRVIRRLARLDMQEGKIHNAREILQDSLRTMPKNGDLLQGLGQLELKCGNTQKARRFFKDAIVASPKFPNPYHALATLEHSEGNIRVATTILRMGLKHCPTNHRLHHALGDLYREARMLDMAEKAYCKGLKCIEAEAEETGRPLDWGKSFLYSALSYISYDKGNVVESREWLRKSIEMANNRMHSQGWVGLAQLEESEGNLDVARKIYVEAVSIYERNRGIAKVGTFPNKYVKPAKLGDKWNNVYKSWTRFEEQYGSYHDANNVYSRAASAFPMDWEILAQWAKFQFKHGREDRARNLFELACDRASSKDARPYRQYAEFEMAAGNYRRARSILFLGAQSLSESSNGSRQDEEFARLYHTWAIVEWHLRNLDRAEILFDHSLRQIGSGSDGSEHRAIVLYSIARFLFYARNDCILAQHCIALSLTENVNPSSDAGVWTLWAKVADSMSNEVLKSQCISQAEELKKNDGPNVSFDVNALAMNQLLRRAPWQHKIMVSSNSKNDSWYKGISFPSSLQTNR